MLLNSATRYGRADVVDHQPNEALAHSEDSVSPRTIDHHAHSGHCVAPSPFKAQFWYQQASRPHNDRHTVKISLPFNIDDTSHEPHPGGISFLSPQRNQLHFFGRPSLRISLSPDPLALNDGTSRSIFTIS